MAQNSEIFDSGLEKWDSDRKSATPPWVLIGLYGFRNLLSSSGCLGRWMFFITIILYYGTITFLTVVKHQAHNLSKIELFSGLAQLGDAYSKFDEVAFVKSSVLYFSLYFSFMAFLFFGSQLISKDRAANAMQVYFSKAVSPFDYLLGKFFSIGILTGIVTIVAGFWMMFLGVLLSPDFLEFIGQVWTLPFKLVTYWLFLTFCFGSFILFFSALFDKSYMAAVAFAGFCMFSTVFTFIVTRIMGARDFLHGLNWHASFKDIGKFIFDLDVIRFGPLGWQVFDVLLACGIFIWFIWRKIKPVEVIS